MPNNLNANVHRCSYPSELHYLRDVHYQLFVCCASSFDSIICVLYLVHYMCDRLSSDCYVCLSTAKVPKCPGRPSITITQRPDHTSQLKDNLGDLNDFQIVCCLYDAATALCGVITAEKASDVFFFMIYVFETMNLY